MASSHPPSSSPSTLPQAAHGRPSSPSSSAGLPSSPSPRSTPFTPCEDTERHPKGKRKRTTASDKTILESAYAENPKPDKAARVAIVNRVSLNEKEVQIWFQNRRQNDRRKARPLSPDELDALRSGGMLIRPDPASFHTSFNSDVTHTSPLQNMPRIERADASPPPGDSSFCDETNTSEWHEPWQRRESNATETRESFSVAQKDDHVAENPDRRRPSCSSSVDLSCPGWRHFSTPAMPGRRGDDPFNHASFTLPNVSSPLLARPINLHPDQSKFRLSLSLDGKAEVVPTIVSPPRGFMPPPPPEDFPPTTIRRLNLQRSNTSPVTLPPISSLFLPARRPDPPRLGRGRSRDVQAWESCCDAEIREDPLTEHAKNESSGSAIAAITLIRSTSASGSPLQPSNSAKRNATMAKATARPGLAKKPRITSVLGSAVKLQSNFGLGEKRSDDKDTANPVKSKFLSGHDSDKENWSPDGDESPHFSFSQTPGNVPFGGRRPLPTPGVRDAAGTNPRRTPARAADGDAALCISRAYTAPPTWARHGGGKSDHTLLKVFEDHKTSPVPAKPDDEEVERFMRGQVSPSKKGAVDAIAGLLSLSKGAWR
ncbi:pah4 homeobox protein encoded by the pah4 protein [Podospora conica]|nr:pah4 homeobox protein encoded by the pah4 protein [Schizothecium conicum]